MRSFTKPPARAKDVTIQDDEFTVLLTDGRHVERPLLSGFPVFNMRRLHREMPGSSLGMARVSIGKQSMKISPWMGFSTHL